MLVLTRKKEESIDIFDVDGKLLVTVCLVKIKGKHVRLGFIAEKDIVILRKELVVGNTPDQIGELICSMKSRGRQSAESSTTIATVHPEENLNLFQELPS